MTRTSYLDNIKIFLVVLVIAHHTAITYAGTGGWYYKEGLQTPLDVGILGSFCAINQAYFMSLFFFISAYFTPASFSRRGARGFIKEKLVRLGIPLVAFDFVLHPLTLGMLYPGALSSPGTSYLEYLRGFDGIGRGPLWFVEALLIFSLIYAAWRAVTGDRVPGDGEDRAFPSPGVIAASVVALAVAGYLVRAVWPVGYVFRPLAFQLPFFPLYIAFYCFGLIAARRGWLDRLDGRVGPLAATASILLMAAFPLMVTLGGAFSGKLPEFMGGLGWRAGLYAFWESALCFAMCTGLLWIFKSRVQCSGPVQKALASSAYTAYIIHTPVLVFITLSLKSVALPPIAKFAVSGSLAVTASFGAGFLLLTVFPGLRRVL
ncbi:MAG: acyltransferase [Myxococcota bacterium]|jgi:hypothetical protein